MATATASAPAPARKRRAILSGPVLPRVVAALAIMALVLALPLLLADFQANQVTRAVIYAVIGLSMNVLTGHAGQISLGHQAFVGLGAFVSGFAATEVGLNFYAALAVAALFGALSALLLGLVALRIGGLYLALITLAYGAVAEESLFNIRDLTRGGEGMPAARPSAFQSDRAYLYLCLIALAVILLIDWRLMKTKAGRAILAIRHDERVASTLGVNVTFYKTFAFMLSGFIAGVAGSLFAHWQTVVVSNDFVIDVALTWVFMTVVGGLGSRAGVVIGSAFFALFPFLFESVLPTGVAEQFTRAVPLIGAILLVLTLTLYPGGIGQQLLPVRRWLAGGPFHSPSDKKRHRKAATVPAGASAIGGTAEAAGSGSAEPPPTGEESVGAAESAETTEEPGRPEEPTAPTEGTAEEEGEPSVQTATKEMPLPPALADENRGSSDGAKSKPRKRAAPRKRRQGGKT